MLSALPDTYGHRYDTRSNKWEAIPAMITARHGHELVAMDNCVYALGGYGDVVLSAVEKFDVKSHKWTAVPSMSEARAWFGGVLK